MDFEDTWESSSVSSFDTSSCNENINKESINKSNMDANEKFTNVTANDTSNDESIYTDSSNDSSNNVSVNKSGSRESASFIESSSDENGKTNNANGISSEIDDPINDDSFHHSSIIGRQKNAKQILNSSTEQKEDDTENTNSRVKINDKLISKANDLTTAVTDTKTNNTLDITTDTKYTGTRPKQIIINSSSSESDDNVSNIIDASEDEEETMFTPKKQLTLPQIFAKQNNNNQNLQQPRSSNSKLIKNNPVKSEDSITVSQAEYDQQVSSVKRLQEEFRKINSLFNTVNLPALPDKGKLLIARHDSLKDAVKMAEAKLARMIINKDLKSANDIVKPAAWDDLKVMSEGVQPKTFGQRAMATLNAQKSLTMERLQQLHTSLSTCPAEDTYAEDPKGLRIELMPHQKHAVAWLLWREGQRPSGGILADDMGLGKTLTMISLMLKSKEIKENLDDDDNNSDEEYQVHRNSKHQGGTLVVCPASLLKQWEGEVEKHCKRFMVSTLLYHGPKRETKAKILAKHDMVITTYSICLHESEKNSPLSQIRWRRIVLDEAHQIRNYKSRTSIAVCTLPAQSRWALTGTPVHNKEEDMYSLLKFLRCSPFDDLAVWKRWVANKNAGGQDRINTVLSSIMLRRTKALLQKNGALQALPERSSETICLKLESQEQAVYQKILIFSRTLFAQYLHQHAEKQGNYMRLGEYSKLSSDPQNVYHQMHQKMVKLNGVKEVKSHQILVLLLRLRQMCCHPSLIVKMLHSDQLESEEDVEGHDEFNLLEEMKKLSVDDNPNDNASNSNQQENNEEFSKSLKELLNPNNPMFSQERKSTKMEAILKLLREKILPTNEKAIIVSQWTSLLQILTIYLKEENILFEELNGSVPVIKRMPIVDNFNNPSHPMKVLLLSLTAGGVGLNLVGGNHMLLLDLHWNPQLEAQAQDRIYRVGQARKVYVYRFMTLNTIEERIKSLQELKLNIANSMLTGSRSQHMKLSLQDLRMLFNM